jgi:hypothetical protein
MQFSLGKFADRWSQASITLCVIYSCACTLTLLTGWGGTGAAAFIGAWGTFPIMLAAAIMLWPVIIDPSFTSATGINDYVLSPR